MSRMPVIVDRGGRVGLLRFTLVSVGGTLATLVGIFAGTLAQDPAPRAVFTVMVGIGAVMLGWTAWISLGAWYRELRLRFSDTFPSQQHRDAIEAEALRLGLRFGRGRAQPFFGNWRGMRVRIYDEVEPEEPTWTHVVLPLPPVGCIIEITRRGFTSFLKSAVGLRALPLGDPEFDRAFAVRTDLPENMRRVMDARVRARLLERTPPGRVCIRVDLGLLIYRCERVSIHERGDLLEIVDQLRQALTSSASAVG